MGGLHNLKCIVKLYEWEFKLLKQGITWVKITVFLTEVTQVINVIENCVVPGVAKAHTNKITP